MTTHGILVSTALTGVLLVAVAVWVLRLRDWRPSPDVAAPAGAPALPGGRALARTGRSQWTWFVLALLAGGAVVASAVLAVQGTIDAMAAVTAMGVVLVGTYLVGGAYVMGRSHSHSTARALAESLVVAGFGVLGVIVVQLVIAGG